MQSPSVDLLVIGGGKAGKSLAMDLAAAAKFVADRTVEVTLDGGGTRTISDAFLE